LPGTQRVWHNLPAITSMHKKDKIKTVEQDENPETIIRQHRRRAYWIEARRFVGEGSLIMTNRRLLFLHRIVASPEVTASIKKLADAPIETVLNHALTLHKNNFQISLSAVIRPGIGVLPGFPLPRFCLSVFYLKGKKLIPYSAAFHFKNPGPGMFSPPQIVTDWRWKRAIQRAIEAAVPLSD
jgi:hypothetical protein